MVSFLRHAVLCALLLSAAAVTRAQLPTLKVLHDKDQGNPVTLESLHTDVRINGNIAVTVMTMTFRNIGARDLEGELTFPMPEGVTLSRYAIDINGKLREAVPVEKARAAEVFENIEHRRVDPGLLEKVEGNNFRTRIYPLPAGGTRTVLVGYEEELHPDRNLAMQYRLPFDAHTAIPDFRLEVRVSQSLVQPELQEQPDGSFSFRNSEGTYIATLSRTNFTPKHSLVINLPKNDAVNEVALQPAEGSYYFLVNTYPKAKSRKREWSDHLGLIWDISLSGLNRDHKKELELLGNIISRKQDLTIELGLLNYKFRKAGTFVIRKGNWDQLRQKLQQLTYDGGTNLGDLRENVLQANEYLMFGDGMSTFGPAEVHINKPMYCITSSVRADFSQLRYLSSRHGGLFINLNNLSVADASRLLADEPLMFLGIRPEAGVHDVYPSVAVPVNGNISVAGIADGRGKKITLQFGYGSKVISERTIQLDAGQEATAINVSKVWAQKKIAELDVQYERNKDEIAALGSQFGIVTRNTSLLVLEAVADYVRYKITPPDELRAEYDRLSKQQLVQQETRMNDLLQSAFGMTATLKAWYNTSHNPVHKKQYPVPDRRADRARADVRGSYDTVYTVDALTSEEAVAAPRQMNVPEPAGEVVPAAAPPVANGYSVTRQQASHATQQMGFKLAPTTRFTSPALQYNAGMAGNTNEGLMDGDALGDRAVQDGARRMKAIRVPEFRSDKAYMKELAGQTVASAYQTYLRMRPKYQTTPLFYYDIAAWFYRNNSRDTALQIFSNIADLDVENAELYKLLAYTLKQHGLYELEIFTAGKVLQWRPMDPQSYRDYALALADGGYYQKALDTLYGTLTRSYSEQSTARDFGIEEILVTEINHLIATHRSSLNLARIDDRLIQPMPVDVRVVLNWNKNETDIDLWVTDPNGEKCFYSNKETSAGGRISDDFTTGFGPEQFMLKKAPKGRYKVQVNYYGDRQLSISGPTSVMAEIYTRYATGQQQRKIVVLQMPAAQKEGVLVGTFDF